MTVRTLPASEKKPAGKQICMLAYTFYESDNCVMRYARALAERSDEVDVIALAATGQPPVVEPIDGVNVYRIQRRERNEKTNSHDLSHSARLILTDSGGLQKEAYWLGAPCITLREETEWVETVDAGWNTLAGSDTEKIVHTVRSLAAPQTRPSLYGEGSVAEKCVAVLE